MKRIIFLFLTVLYIVCITSFVFAADNSLQGTFYAAGVRYADDGPPFHRLQNIFRFQFIDGQEVHNQFSIEYKEAESAYGPSLHKIDFYLTYDQKAAIDTEQNVITGTFTYYHNFNGVIREYEGNVLGSVVDSIDQADLTYDKNKTIIMLDLEVTNGSWDWKIYLETTDDIQKTTNTITKAEKKPHLPKGAKQKEVAVGVGLSTLGIVLVNAVTKTSISSAVSFNTTSPVSKVPPTMIISQDSSGGILVSIKKAVISLLLDLRDMLTDEGRSYVSGKISERIIVDKKKDKV